MTLSGPDHIEPREKAVVFSAEYDPFGVLLTSSTSEPFRYTGEKHDDKTGLVYLRACQYEPEIGRFASAALARFMPIVPERIALVVEQLG